MTDPDPSAQHEAACAWLDPDPIRADDDIATIHAVLALPRPRQGIAAYHLQQAAEKIMKGLLTAAAVPFRRTHSLNELGDQVIGVWPDLATAIDPLRPHSTWSFAFRYPLDEILEEDEPTDIEIEAALVLVHVLRDRFAGLAVTG